MNDTIVFTLHTIFALSASLATQNLFALPVLSIVPGIIAPKLLILLPVIFTLPSTFIQDHKIHIQLKFSLQSALDNIVFSITNYIYSIFQVTDPVEEVVGGVRVKDGDLQEGRVVRRALTPRLVHLHLPQVPLQPRRVVVDVRKPHHHSPRPCVRMRWSWGMSE